MRVLYEKSIKDLKELIWDVIEKNTKNGEINIEKARQMIIKNPEYLSQMGDIQSTYYSLYNKLEDKLDKYIKNVTDSEYADFLFYIISLGKEEYNKLIKKPALCENPEYYDDNGEHIGGDYGVSTVFSLDEYKKEIESLSPKNMPAEYLIKNGIAYTTNVKKLVISKLRKYLKTIDLDNEKVETMRYTYYHSLYEIAYDMAETDWVDDILENESRGAETENVKELINIFSSMKVED